MNKLKLVLILISAICAGNSGFAQVGINTTTPLSTLDINGNLNVKEIGIFNALVTGSGPFNGGPIVNKTVIDDGVYISLTPTAGNTDFILPNAALVPGRIYILRNISNSVNAYIYTNGGALFAQDSDTATPSPREMKWNATGKTIIFISDGINWTYIL
jgi:hypothetical protein